MVTFTAFSNLLPDPANPITDAGDISVTGTPGPGFSAVGFQSNTETQVSRTNSGRGITRDGGSQYWSFSISYNPMFREQFDPVDSFLAMRNPRRDPFYVILPQYSRPKNAGFLAAVNAVQPTIGTAVTAGSSSILVRLANTTINATARPGDMFTITDPTNYNHQKVYKVGAVETANYYQAGTVPPAADTMRVWISPPLQRSVSAGSLVTFVNPKFRVISKSDVQEYQLDTNNLYSFSLAVEEIQP
jgi:hypothetical protein